MNPLLKLYTDACQSGFGAYFAWDWPYGSLADHNVPLSRSISFKKLFSIAAAVNTWAASLACRNILFHCDNLFIVHTLSGGTSKCKHVMTLLSFLFYICAYHNIMFWPSILTGLTIIRLTLSLVFRSTSSWPPGPCLPAFCRRLQDLCP